MKLVMSLYDAVFVDSGTSNLALGVILAACSVPRAARELVERGVLGRQIKRHLHAARTAARRRWRSDREHGRRHGDRLAVAARLVRIAAENVAGERTKATAVRLLSGLGLGCQQLWISANFVHTIGGGALDRVRRPLDADKAKRLKRCGEHSTHVACGSKQLSFGYVYGVLLIFFFLLR